VVRSARKTGALLGQGSSLAPDVALEAPNLAFGGNREVDGLRRHEASDRLAAQRKKRKETRPAMNSVDVLSGK